MKASALASATVALAVIVAAGPVWASPEKGTQKCSDGVDNDNDGLIDGADPDCGGGGGDGGGGGGEATGNFHVVINWDDAVTDHVFNDVAIVCANNGKLCDIAGDDSFTFKIPESYWSQWTLSEAQECFGASLGYGMDAEVSAQSFFARDHHGSPDHWDVHVYYTASFIGTVANGDHVANLQGDCVGPCPDLPPAVGTTNSYGDGYLTRTQTGSRLKKGTACTCAWEDCAFSPNAVTVTIERLP